MLAVQKRGEHCLKAKRMNPLYHLHLYITIEQTVLHALV
jgi:hypothetical protein